MLTPPVLLPPALLPPLFAPKPPALFRPPALFPNIPPFAAFPPSLSPPLPAPSGVPLVPPALVPPVPGGALTEHGMQTSSGQRFMHMAGLGPVAIPPFANVPPSPSERPPLPAKPN